MIQSRFDEAHCCFHDFPGLSVRKAAVYAGQCTRCGASLSISEDGDWSYSNVKNMPPNFFAEEFKPPPLRRRNPPTEFKRGPSARPPMKPFKKAQQ